MAEHEKYMERAYETIESARILFENGKYNASTSQAYYSMFYASKALLSLKGDLSEDTQRVVSELGLKFVNEGLSRKFTAENWQGYADEGKSRLRCFTTKPAERRWKRY